MASSFITKDNTHGFWIKDFLMQVVCWGIVDAIDETAFNDNRWLKDDFREHIFNNSQGIFNGFMHLRLDEFIINQKRQNQFNEIISRVKEIFLNKGDYISVQELNGFQLTKETKHEWLSPLETHRVIKILEYLKDVVNDKISSKDSDEIDYEF